MEVMDPQIYSQAFKVSYLVFGIPTALVFVSAILSAKEMGGGLGRGMKKISAGSVVHTSLIMTYLALERGNIGLLQEPWVSMLFLFGGIFGAILLVSGYVQLYKISKKLRLFTP
jgi:hypothetical protein